MAFMEQKQFYNGSAWKKTKRAFMSSKNGICERCGSPARIVHHKTYITPLNIHDPSITLSWDNLEALCQDCHNKEHSLSPATAEGISFDENGNVVKI